MNLLLHHARPHAKTSFRPGPIRVLMILTASGSRVTIPMIFKPVIHCLCDLPKSPSMYVLGCEVCLRNVSANHAEVLDCASQASRGLNDSFSLNTSSLLRFAFTSLKSVWVAPKQLLPLHHHHLILLLLACLFSPPPLLLAQVPSSCLSLALLRVNSLCFCLSARSFSFLHFSCIPTIVKDYFASSCIM